MPRRLPAIKGPTTSAIQLDTTTEHVSLLYITAIYSMLYKRTTSYINLPKVSG